ncbi:hypothetical protein LTR70_004752 [Exophiala xenobiotica]|uniref:Uncharacterized protein n=1 Tax=Lithohypha guttulata TaxID=1690604 RepID=A0ABR0KCN4_9EURO|nr:hypothetical protein LTR24_004368 [Lithohypha guttulata]KAK5319966.1 hypothetical protein LTR70_004752 [Exophiala xenobiotica]
MPFKDSGTYPLSDKDVVSFAFDDPAYDLDKPLFINPANPSEYYTYNTARLTVCQLIAGLKHAGLQPHDTVCIHSFNSLLYPLLILAILGAGGRSVGTNPSYTKAELSHSVRIAKVKFVLAEPEILSNMQDALRENNIDLTSRLFILDTNPTQTVPPNHRSWRTLLSHGSSPWLRFNDPTTSATTVAQLYYTSGTTGLPKCAQTTHRNLTSEHQLFFESNPRSYPIRLVLAMPFFHVGIAPQVFVSVLREGRAAYIMRRFELQPYLQYHAKYALTETFMVPPMVNSIVMSGLADESSPNYRADCSLRTVRNGTVGAAPCSADLQARFQRLLGAGATFSQVWGMTETTSMAMMVPWSVARGCSARKPGLETAWGSVGVPLPGNAMKLVNEAGEDVTSSGKGELCVKGPSVVKGYFENEKATSESWDVEGYFHTGDVIEVRPHTDPETGEEHALCFVVERLKELIKVRGFQVAPAELEGALTEHPDIVDAAVIGLPTRGQDGSELPKAYIVKREGSQITGKDVMAHMKERLARYKQLEGGVEFVEDIPKLPSGKILKRVLREQAKKQAQREGSVPKL